MFDPHLLQKESVLLSMIIRAAERRADFMIALQEAVPRLADEYPKVEAKLSETLEDGIPG